MRFRRYSRLARDENPAVVNRILGHLEVGGGRDPFDARAPPEGEDGAEGRV